MQIIRIQNIKVNKASNQNINNSNNNIQVITFQQDIEKVSKDYQYDISIDVNNTQEVVINKYSHLVGDYLVKFIKIL